MSTRTLRRAGVAVAVALFAASLALPALEISGGPTLRGIDVLGRGVQAFASGVYAWLANPLFLVAAVACWAGRRRAGGVLAGAACALAITSFAGARLARSAGVAVPEFSFVAGFYLWLAAHFVLLLACLAPAALRRDT